ncbi:type II secretion system protein [Enterovibrio calviensis]|uniref:type II secretion system protein n=1 Tax=Enterovibrio calviensis TaxID=91359 RepID=UPI000487DCCD|nr:type II secretion system protein [Enterovibrio calviensis]
MKKNGQKGFSLLEAIVALTLLAGAGMALFSWINNSLVQMQLAGAYNQADQAILSAKTYLNTQDFNAKKEGVFSSSGVDVYWKATQVAEEKRGAEGSNYNLNLYQVSLQANVNGRQLPKLTTRYVRYTNLGGAEVPFG